MEQINSDFSKEKNENNANQNTSKFGKTFFSKFFKSVMFFKSVIPGILIFVAIFAFGFMGKKVFSLFSLLKLNLKKEVISKDVEISFTILDIKDVLKFYSKEIPFSEFSLIEFGEKGFFKIWKDESLYIDRGVVKLGLDFTDIPETALIVDRENKKITINYPVSLNDRFIVNVIIDYASSEYYSISDSWLRDSSEARLKENEIHQTMLKRAEEKYRTPEYLEEVKKEVKERIIEYCALFAPEYAVEVNL